MNEALRQRILAYNRALAQRKEQAGDLQVIVDELRKLPYGQLKKVLTDPVLEVLEKYGLGVTMDE